MTDNENFKLENDKLVKEYNESLFKEKETIDVCDINIADIVSQLHKNAVEKATKSYKKFKIVNSAIDDSKENANFIGGGQHIIFAAPLEKEFTKDPKFKEESLEAIQVYVNWFAGPDIAKNLNLDDLAYKTEKIDSDDDSDNSSYKKDNNEKDDTETDLNNESKYLDSFVSVLFETTQTEDEEAAKNNNQQIVGYYIEWIMNLGKDRDSTVESAWKRLGKLLASELGNTKIEWFSLYGGDKGTTRLEDLVPKKHFINAEELPGKFQTVVSQEYPMAENNITSSVIDLKTIIHYLNKRLTSKDKKYLSDLSAKYALAVKVAVTNNKVYKLISKREIADMTTKAIGTKFLTKILNINKIDPDDIVLVNNYRDNGMENTTVADSLKVKNILNLIFEDLNIFNEASNKPPKPKRNIEIIFKQILPETKKFQKKVRILDTFYIKVKDIKNDNIKSVAYPSESDLNTPEVKQRNLNDGYWTIPEDKFIEEIKNKYIEDNNIKKIKIYYKYNLPDNDKQDNIVTKGNDFYIIPIKRLRYPEKEITSLTKDKTETETK